jgi:hypothetical protein
MKRTKKYTLLQSSLVVLACVGLVACGGGGGTSGGGSGTSGVTPPAGLPITVTVSPTAIVTLIGNSRQFNATVSNTANTTVNWSVSPAIGTISGTGLYTAPGALAAAAAVTVTATSQQDPSKTGSAVMIVVGPGSGANNALFNGRYAFAFVGSENTNGVFVAGGNFLADGNGNITDGHEDGNFAGGQFGDQPFTGAYVVGADRRGIMVISNTTPASCGCAPTQFMFKFNVVSSDLANFIESDSTGPGKGTIERQDTSAFSLSALDGSFAFLLDGLDFNNRLSLAGRFTSSAGALSAGIADVNNGPTVTLAQAISGTLTLGANGRGTASLSTPVGQTHFAYYIVSKDKVLLVGTDNFPVLSGTALRQSSSPFSNASLLGNYVFGMTASTHPRPQKVIRADAGIFQADGAGLLSNGVLDRNSASGVVSGTPLNGTYSIASNGRGTATWNTGVGAENIVFYLTSANEAFALQVDASTTVNNVTSGKLLLQGTSPFSAASWQGQYGLAVTGSSSATVAPTNISGVLSADGVGTLTTVQDIYDGSLHADVSINGSYAVQASGQGTASFPTTPTNFKSYFASASQIFLIGMDPGQVRFATAVKQQ